MYDVLTKIDKIMRPEKTIKPPMPMPTKITHQISIRNIYHAPAHNAHELYSDIQNYLKWMLVPLATKYFIPLNMDSMMVEIL